jgi:hypothetical protein
MVQDIVGKYSVFHPTVHTFVLRQTTHMCSEATAWDLTAASAEPSIDIVCYGIGNFAKSPAARLQLALLCALAQRWRAHVTVFDPALVPEEHQLATDLGLQVLDSNDLGLHAVGPGRKTLFYMPHCCLEMYNNVLWSNWGPNSSLPHLALLGNSFSQYVLSHSDKHMRQHAPCVLQAVAFCDETPAKSSCPVEVSGLCQSVCICVCDAEEDGRGTCADLNREVCICSIYSDGPLSRL